MSADYKGYHATPAEQKKVGKDAEWEVIYILDRNGWVTDRFDKGGGKVPRIGSTKFGYIYLPDIWACRGGEWLIIEVKRKSPTAHGSFGISMHQVVQTRLIAEHAGALALFVVWDETTNKPIYCNMEDINKWEDDVFFSSLSDGRPSYAYVHRNMFSDFETFVVSDYAEYRLGLIEAVQDERRGIVRSPYELPPMPRPLPDIIAEMDEDLREEALELMPLALLGRHDLGDAEVLSSNHRS